MDDLTRYTREVEGKIGYTFQNQRLLLLAFTHRSFYNEYRERVSEHNERLEFLGDAVLGLMISEDLYAYLPHEAEGELSKLRSRLVEASTCSKFLQKLGLETHVLLGRGERANQGRGRETILADLFEALIGAIYLDGGLDAVRKFFWGHFRDDIRAILKNPTRNWKADLQDYSQKRYQRPPIYKIEKAEGPDHKKIFHVSVYLADIEMGRGSGASKKEAEQAAAEAGLKKLIEG
jgi:ribonuclease-3